MERTEIVAGSDMNGLKTRPSLLLRVRDLRDQKSWNEFVELYGPLVLRYLRRIGVPPQDAMDLLQDVLQIVVRHIGSFQYDPGKSFRAWLRTIATNRAYRYFWAKNRQPIPWGGTTHLGAIQDVPNRDGGQSDEDWIEEEWQKRRMEVAINKVRGQVKEQTWQIFELHFLQYRSASEIAAQLGIKVGAVFTSLCRILKRLRKAVEEIDE